MIEVPKCYGKFREMSKELNLVPCDLVKGLDATPRFQLQCAVYHNKRERLL